MPATPTRCRVAAILLVAAAEALSLVPTRATGADLSFEFRGVVEPMQRVTIASHLNGIVDDVLFTPGATVAVGYPLFRIDPKVEIVLPTGQDHAKAGRPRFDSASIDPATGMLTAWAEVPNPAGTLVPSLAVTIISPMRLPEGAK